MSYFESNVSHELLYLFVCHHKKRKLKKTVALQALQWISINMCNFVFSRSKVFTTVVRLQRLLSNF